MTELQDKVPNDLGTHPGPAQTTPEQATKKAYRRPQLVDYGDLTRRTQGGPSGTDNVSPGGGT